jgi:hypothetical protein
MTTFPDSRRRAWAASLREFVDHGGETAAWLSSIPGFVALWRVGARGVTGLERAESQRIEPERYLLVAEQSISLSDRARLEATLAADRGTRLLRLRTSTPSRIRERSRLCCREVWDLGLAAELIAGDDALRLEAREYSIGSPQPNAALDLCRSLIELMVRAWPEPFMFRSAVRRGSPAGFPEGLDPQAESKRVLAELCRGMGDAWLILLGRYDIPLPERLRRLLDHFATRPILKSILSWAYGERPLDAELPEDAKTMWFELRALMLDAYANALQQETRPAARPWPMLGRRSPHARGGSARPHDSDPGRGVTEPSCVDVRLLRPRTGSLAPSAPTSPSFRAGPMTETNDSFAQRFGLTDEVIAELQTCWRGTCRWGIGSWS